MEKRRKLAESLIDDGHNAIVMEDFKFPNSISKRPIFKKFIHLLNRKYDIISVIIPKSAEMHGVVFELALILMKYGEEKFRKHVRFFVEIGTSVDKKMPLYAKQYMKNIRYENYCGWDSLKELIEDSC